MYNTPIDQMRIYRLSFFLLSLCLLTGCSPVSDHGNIAFLSRDQASTTGKIAILSPDGSKITQLTTGLASDGCPHWSPDGQRIAFASSNSVDDTAIDRKLDLYVVDKNGRNLTRVTDGPGDVYGVDWSPDGEKLVIAASSERKGLPRFLFTMDADGTDLQQIQMDVDFLWIFHPGWSPDGQSILFSGSIKSDRVEYPKILYAIQIGQTIPEPITETDPKLCRSDLGGNWSPDGTSILFSTSDYYCGISPYRIRRMDILTGVSVDYPNYVEHSMDQSPVWSLDGKSIVFSSTRGNMANENLGSFDIYRMNVDGTGLTRLTTSGDNLCPDIQP